MCYCMGFPDRCRGFSDSQVRHKFAEDFKILRRLHKLFFKHILVPDLDTPAHAGQNNLFVQLRIFSECRRKKYSALRIERTINSTGHEKTLKGPNLFSYQRLLKYLLFNKSPLLIGEGKEITVPALTEAPGMPELPSEPRPRPRRRARTPKVYLAEDVVCVVEAGDTLEEIARRHYGVRHKWPRITSDPRNAGIDARRLRPGDKIVVPALTE